MPGLLLSPGKNSGFRGLPRIIEFTNHDGKHVRSNCGQAASTTVLNFFGHPFAAADVESARPLMEPIESKFPPNIFFGWFGTSGGRVRSILNHFQYDYETIRTTAQLKQRLDQGLPVLLMLQVTGGKFWKWEIPGGHWVVAWGYDADNIYLTNWGSMNWDEFHKSWNGIIPKLIRMNQRGICPKRK